MSSEIINHGEFVQVHNDIHNKEELMELATLFTAISNETQPEEDVIATLNQKCLAILSHYQDTSMLGIPWCEDGENYYIELDVGTFSTDVINLHNNANQLHHLVHMISFISEEPLHINFPSEEITLKVPENSVFIYPAGFSFRFVMMNKNTKCDFVRMSFAFKSEK